MSELKVDNPEPGGKGHFALILETLDDLSDESFDTIKTHIEFRRQCCNQGFDNLLELIEMTRKATSKMRQKALADKPPHVPEDGK